MVRVIKGNEYRQTDVLELDKLSSTGRVRKVAAKMESIGKNSTQ